MKISNLVNRLKEIQKQEGDVEVTCTGSNLADGHGGAIPDVFETTVENLIIRDNEIFGKHVRLYL